MKWICRISSVLGVCQLLSGCAITRPCAEGGDTRWRIRFDGDQTCFQVKDASGQIVNHGEYRYLDTNKKIRLEGQFYMGKKQGDWVEFDESGARVLEKRYERGVEKSSTRHDPDR